ncbi:MAG: DUF1461 domain-containing protein [Chloroflexi bacterium]|nr:DUF1461 domain-containing protein [Chloroflexota bacterium]
MTRLARFTAVLFVLSVPLFLISNSVIWALNSPGVYNGGFEKYGVSRTTGIEQENLRQVGADLRRFFNTRGTLSVQAEVRGVERDIFNPREILHMRDVKRLVWLVYGVATLSGVFLLLFTGIGVMARPRFPREVTKLCIWGGGLTIGLVAAIGLFALVGFDALFLKFHQLSFSNDLWQLNERDYLLLLFPQDFWLDATIWVATRAVAGAALLMAVFGGYLAYQRWTDRRAAPDPVGTADLG